HPPPSISHLFLPLTPPPPSSTPFPYTTLFRSDLELPALELQRGPHTARAALGGAQRSAGLREQRAPGRRDRDSARQPLGVSVTRSEEHTSELQSRGHLVCRLLLEKKKHKLDAA